MKLIENKNYRYSTLEEWAKKNDYEMTEYGREYVGEHFITLVGKTNHNWTISFVLVMGGVNGYYYKCIYDDRLKKEI